MKKIFILGTVLLVISLGFTACDLFKEKGGTVKLVNDTNSTQYFAFFFGSRYQSVNDGQSQLMAGASVKAVSDDDTSYAVYSSSSGYGTALWSGRVSGGETITHYFSDKQ